MAEENATLALFRHVEERVRQKFKDFRATPDRYRLRRNRGQPLIYKYFLVYDEPEEYLGYLNKLRQVLLFFQNCPKEQNTILQAYLSSWLI